MPRGLRIAVSIAALTCFSALASSARAQAPAYQVRDINALPEVSGSNPSSLLSSGAAVLFSCSLLHEALPVTAGQRFALLSFLRDAGDPSAAT